MTENRITVAALRADVLALPAEIEVDGAALRCDTPLRRMRGKRLVCSGSWGGKPVLAKLYFATRRAAAHAAREIKGAQALARSGVDTPSLLYTGIAQDVHVVLYERIAAPSAALVWNACGDDTARIELLRGLSRALAQLHRAGLAHQDPHPDNFLIREERVIVIDAAAISEHAAPLNAAIAFDNLALLLAQFAPQHDRLFRSALAGYTDEAPDWAALEERIAAHRDKREREYLQKIFRESTPFVCVRKPKSFYVCDRHWYSAAMREALQRPEQLLRDARMLKQGNSATVGIAHIDGIDIVVKRYNLKSLGHRLKRAVQRSRAANAWRNAHLLRFRGIATPEPIAMIEQRFGPFRGVAYYLSAYEPGPNCVDYLDDPAVPPPAKAQAAWKIRAMLDRLRAAGIGHGDLKATNILIADGEPTLIDLDAMRRYRHAGAAAQAHRRDVRRFLRNWEDRPEAAALFAGLASEQT